MGQRHPLGDRNRGAAGLAAGARATALPRRGDIPVILTVALLHMGAFAVLTAFGLQLVPAGRSIVLGYTTPLWVAPAAWLFLREPVARSQLAGIGWASPASPSCSIRWRSTGATAMH